MHNTRVCPPPEGEHQASNRVQNGGPNSLAITPNGRTLYVVNGDAGTVTPVSTATNKAGRSVKVGLEPVAVAIVP